MPISRTKGQPHTPSTRQPLVAHIRAIEGFEVHHDEQRLEEAVRAAFSHCFDVRDLQILMPVLVTLAVEFEYHSQAAMDCLFDKASCWKDRRATVLMVLADYIEGSPLELLRPVSLKVVWEEGNDGDALRIQGFLADHLTELWDLALEETPARYAAAYLLGEYHDHGLDDLELMLELIEGEVDTTWVATVLLALGTAGRFAAHKQPGCPKLVSLKHELERWWAAPDTLVATLAVCAHTLLEKRMKHPASNVLRKGILERVPVPREWDGSLEQPRGWKGWDTLYLACTIIRWYEVDDSALLLRSLNEMSEGWQSALVLPAMRVLGGPADSSAS